MFKLHLSFVFVLIKLFDEVELNNNEQEIDLEMNDMNTYEEK